MWSFCILLKWIHRYGETDLIYLLEFGVSDNQFLSTRLNFVGFVTNSYLRVQHCHSYFCVCKGGLSSSSSIST